MLCIKAMIIEKLDCVYIFVDNEVWLCEREVVLEMKFLLIKILLKLYIKNIWNGTQWKFSFSFMKLNNFIQWIYAI